MRVRVKGVPFLESMAVAHATVEREDVGKTAVLNKLPHDFVEDVFGALVVMFAGINEKILVPC